MTRRLRSPSSRRCPPRRIELNVVATAVRRLQFVAVLLTSSANDRILKNGTNHEHVLGVNLNKPRGDHEMASVRQLEANRANARKSTGPRTETGKAIARLNALRHGLTSQKRVTLVGESEFDYLRLREKLMFEFDPQTSVQTHLVDQLANHLWRLKRVAPFEAGILNLTRGAV